ncbi:MAG: ROK family protein [Planctomycetes bacterium]|nr:ROK family protein [Planctomycetota bacterium]
MANRLAIEIGGTKLQLGVGDGSSAKLDALLRRDVDPVLGANGILATIESEAGELVRAYGIERAGIAFGGPVEAGVVTTSHQIAGWDRFPLARWFRDRLGISAVVGNDCDAAALAESRFGAGRSSRAVFYVTVGTGIGGGLVIGGRLHGFDRPAVAEIGHLRPGLDAVSETSTVESMASGWGLARGARRICEEALEKDAACADAIEWRQRAGGDLSRLTAKDIGDLASRGNAMAQQAMTRSLNVLGWAIAQAVTLIAPDVVVVGGGVSLIGERAFFEPLLEAVARYVFPPLRDRFRIVAAELGEEVVVVGGLLLATGAHGD